MDSITHLPSYGNCFICLYSECQNVWGWKGFSTPPMHSKHTQSQLDPKSDHVFQGHVSWALNISNGDSTMPSMIGISVTCSDAPFPFMNDIVLVTMECKWYSKTFYIVANNWCLQTSRKSAWQLHEKHGYRQFCWLFLNPYRDQTATLTKFSLNCKRTCNLLLWY